MKKTICILCAMLVAGMMSSSLCLATDEMNSFDLYAEEIVVPYYLTIYNPNAIASRSGSYIFGDVSASYYTGYTAKMTVTVQRSTNEINWTKAGSMGTVNGSNGKVSLSGDYPAISGYYYRLEATVTVYDGGSVVETLTFHSNII